MALRKTIAAEPFELAEGPLGEFLVVAACDHAGDELFLERRHTTGELERRHGAAKLIGLSRREARAFDGNPHRLLLEERHSQGLTQHLFKFGLRINDGFLTLAAPEIGMNHVALDRSGTHDRHLHHKVVELTRPQARQHRHLRAALDLEYAQ